jgi:hypothetical protein
MPVADPSAWLSSGRDVVRQLRSLPRDDLPAAAEFLHHLADHVYKTDRPPLIRKHCRLLALMCEAVVDGSHPGALVVLYDEIEAALRSEDPIDLLNAATVAEAEAALLEGK